MAASVRRAPPLFPHSPDESVLGGEALRPLHEWIAQGRTGEVAAYLGPICPHIPEANREAWRDWVTTFFEGRLRLEIVEEGVNPLTDLSVTLPLGKLGNRLVTCDWLGKIQMRDDIHPAIEVGRICPPLRETRPLFSSHDRGFLLLDATGGWVYRYDEESQLLLKQMHIVDSKSITSLVAQREWICLVREPRDSWQSSVEIYSTQWAGKQTLMTQPTPLFEQLELTAHPDGRSLIVTQFKRPRRGGECDNLGELRLYDLETSRCTGFFPLNRQALGLDVTNWFLGSDLAPKFFTSSTKKDLTLHFGATSLVIPWEAEQAPYALGVLIGGAWVSWVTALDPYLIACYRPQRGSGSGERIALIDPRTGVMLFSPQSGYFHPEKLLPLGGNFYLGDEQIAPLKLVKPVCRRPEEEVVSDRISLLRSELPRALDALKAVLQADPADRWEARLASARAARAEQRVLLIGPAAFLGLAQSQLSNPYLVVVEPHPTPMISRTGPLFLLRVDASSSDSDEE